MAKKQQPKSIQIDTYTAGIFGRTEGYADRVRQLYAKAVTELLKLTASQGIGEDETFEFDKLPKRLREEANKILRLLYASVYNEVQHGIRAEWQYANLSNDIIIKRIFGDAVFKNEGNHFARWFARNEQAMDAFLKRKSGPKRLGLSERIWNYTGQLKDEMELALSVSMGEGESASSISRRVRQYLQEPDRLFRHVKGKDGKMRWSKAAKEYLKTHDVGRGQYLSSYKNAMRLTRTETNMAYRSADCERWQQLDFVLGIHIERSKRGEKFECELCDQLAGDYPKGFNFTGWHPQCRCIATPILATVDEMVAMRKAMKEGKNPRSVLAPGRYVTEPPRGFTDWVANNRERIENAASVPYFIRDNFKDGNIDNGYSWVKQKKVKTEEEKQAILAEKAAWDKHKVLINKMGNNVYNVAAQYPDIDLSELVNAINKGQLTKIEQQAKAVAQQVGKLNKQLKGMESLIDNPKQWMQTHGFKVSELQGAFDSVSKKMDDFKAKYQKTYHSETEEEYIQEKLKWELNYFLKHQSELAAKYSTWEVTQDAYTKLKKEYDDKVEWLHIKNMQADLNTKLASGLYASQIDILDKAVNAQDKTAAQAQIAVLQQWVKIDDVLEEAMSFKTKSTPYTDLITQLQNNIMSGNLTAAQSTVVLMQQKREELKKKADRRAAKRAGKADTHVIFKAEDLTQARKDAAFYARSKSESIDHYVDEAIDTRAKATDAEFRSMHSYTVGSGYITKPLRNIPGWGYNYLGERDKTIRDVENMTNYIARSRITEDIWIQRDERLDLTMYKFGLSEAFFIKLEKEIHDYEVQLDKLYYYSKRIAAIDSAMGYGGLKQVEHEPLVQKQYAALKKLQPGESGYVMAQQSVRDACKHAKEELERDRKQNLIKFASSKLVGKVGVDESFQSCGSAHGDEFTGTGTDNKYGRCKVKLNIYCPKGTQLTYAEPYNEYGQHDGSWKGEKPDYARENETILQRGTKYRITKAEFVESEDRWYIDVEIIEQNPRKIKDFVWDPNAKNHPMNGGGYGAYHVEFE